ncbi:hypothetical protein CONPUDRAFT_81797 [Coniophora puteana RWD-64-598 SS2]|uniref:RING-type domain-containing protein n=1 Tax=Coniophora puteana (strain RWD-64-598) TaxID=741705 RepID=A0A5M3MT54_CONPW|nr:uncharacterized protein CONPUDRAFT_81797 [Coniophora puteana RWD-64-598 SS2]EIW82270.1 hypothetical protein CONPUDRAFT_81797 [Coniophora puteana RWD-64-598 SS2]
MSVKRSSKGKKRALEESPKDRSSSSLSPVPSETPPPVKKPKRAITKLCPVCNEQIPVRLLSAHSELESQRVEDILRNVGSPEVLEDADDVEEGPSSRSRRSALKARKSLSAMTPRGDSNSLDAAVKAIQTVTRRRKQRHLKLKEMAKQEDLAETLMLDDGSGGITCPVCQQSVRGDKDVVEAHVDACLAHQAQRQQEQRALEEEDIDIGDTVLRVTDGANLRGMGFEVRSDRNQDVEDDIDVDGDDGAIFGEAQFTEGDILASHEQPPEEDADGEDDEARDRYTLRDLVAEGKVVRRTTNLVEGLKAEMEEVMGVGDAEKMDLAVANARRRGDMQALVLALESKVRQLESMRVSSSTSSICRICLDPYAEPTVSTGCWHTCCRHCWLRCLGSTALCPICKRITAASDLRRVFL